MVETAPNQRIVRLPGGGELRLCSGRSEVILEAHVHPDTLRRSLDALRALPRDLFITPDVIATQQRLVLRYAEPPETVGFEDFVSKLCGDPLTCVPTAVQLSAFVARVARACEAWPGVLMPTAPLLLRCFGSQEASWRAIAVPLALALDLGDWARADGAFWQWLPPGVLLGGSHEAAGFAAASCLHRALFGDIGPPLLTEAEHFARRFAGRGVAIEGLRSRLAALLPPSMTEEVEQLHAVAAVLAQPSETHAAAMASDLLPELRARLTTERLAARWEYHGRPELATRVAGTDVSSAPEPAVTAAAELAELRRQLLAGEFSGELAQHILAIEHRHGELDEGCILNVALLEARFGDPSRALSRIRARLVNRWNEAMRLLLWARLELSAQRLPRVNAHVAEALKLLASMPDQGGPVGRYAQSYLLLIDSIAHFAAVAAFRSPSYLMDAFDRLARGLRLASELKADDLVSAAIEWLYWISAYSQLELPGFDVVRLGTSALLECYGHPRAIAHGEMEVPAAPWFDPDVLFPHTVG